MKWLAIISVIVAILLISCESSERERSTIEKPSKAASVPVRKNEKPQLPLAAMPVRQPAVAGSFYPADPAKLKEIVLKYIDDAKAPQIKEKPIAIIAPHAGYTYSGAVAGYSFKAIRNLHIDTVVLLGPPHTRAGRTSIATEGYYKTSLGKIQIDSEMAKEIAAKAGLHYYPEAHESEHCIEVELPFLILTLSEFEIVPILLHSNSLDFLEKLADAIAEAAKTKKVLLVASTDLSHYPVSAEIAEKIDRKTLKSWESMDIAEVRRVEKEQMAAGVRNLGCTMCGSSAVITVMLAAKKLGADRLQVLKYSNSAAAPVAIGDRVVGYGAAILLDTDKLFSRRQPRPSGRGLSEESKKALLTIARRAIEAAIKGETLSMPQKPPTEQLDIVPSGIFVTIENKRRAQTLRGCIGTFKAKKPLYQIAHEYAIASATRDWRFVNDRITPDELPQLTIKVSILSPLKLVKSIDEIELGKHGISIRKGRRGGTYLPEVAEHFKTKEQFLSSCCADKAGLPPNAWKEKETQIYVYTTEVIEEK